MPEPDRRSETIVRNYAVLCGLTPLVPLPFVDDLVKGYFRRRMVRGLAAARAAPLAPADVQALADERRGGCLTGCLGAAFVYPLKRIFRKIFFFLEWKRAVDTASETYHFGSLVDYALQERWMPPAGEIAASRVRAGVDAVLQRRGTGPIEIAVRESFSRSKAGVASAARGLRRALGGLGARPADDQVERALQESALARDGAPLADDLGRALDDVPPSYMAGLCRQLADEVKR